MANNFNFTYKFEVPPSATRALRAASERALKEVSGQLTGRFNDALKDAAWPWPRSSMRGVPGGTVGEIAKNWNSGRGHMTGSPRSITDSGNLAGSLTTTVSGLEASWVWSANYAAAVHDGAWIYPWGNKKAEKVELPARPWTTAVLVGGTPGDIDVFDFSGKLAARVSFHLS